jgi:protein tyrosine phosphatase
VSHGLCLSLACFLHFAKSRTGTFSAIVLAKMKRFEVTFFSSSSVMSPVNNIDSKDIALEPAIDLSGMNKSALSKSDVVDIVVDMRRSRDGLVETPTQLKFVMDVLQLQ